MKSTYRHIITVALVAITVSGSSTGIKAQGCYAVKAGAEIGVANSISLQSNLNGMTAKGNTANYGAEFGWTFWQKSGNSLELNIGVGYSTCNINLDMPSLDYNYSAPASADMDGNTYQRYYRISDIKQKSDIGHFTLPIYLSYGYRCTDWLRIHADLGVRFGFKTSNKIKSCEGSSYSYGIYPQYDNLKIDADYLNDFGTTGLSNVEWGTPTANGFTTNVFVGVGAEFKLYGPLALDVALRYNAALTSLYKGVYDNNSFTAETAPVTYTVKDGQGVKSLTDYASSLKLSSLGIKLGLVVRF